MVTNKKKRQKVKLFLQTQQRVAGSAPDCEKSGQFRHFDTQIRPPKIRAILRRTDFCNSWTLSVIPAIWGTAGVQLAGDRRLRGLCTRWCNDMNGTFLIFVFFGLLAILLRHHIHKMYIFQICSEETSVKMNVVCGIILIVFGILGLFKIIG